jgi:hypothetical protein
MEAWKEKTKKKWKKREKEKRECRKFDFSPDVTNRRGNE